MLTTTRAVHTVFVIAIISITGKEAKLMSVIKMSNKKYDQSVFGCRAGRSALSIQGFQCLGCQG